MQQRLESIHEVCVGRWYGLLPQYGVKAEHLNGKHHPCPMCGGTDRWRWNDKGKPHAGYHCNQCGHGSGVDLVMRLSGMSFPEASKELREKCDKVKPEWKRASETSKFDGAEWSRKQWASAQALERGCLVDGYLRSRGIALEALPSQLRLLSRARYNYEDKRTPTYHPAMIAHFVSPDTKQRTTHITYLDAMGGKAKVPEAKKLAPGKVPVGGAIRLMPSAETMGIAEGIETALSASILHGVPVWSALDACRLMKWEPPSTVKCVLVFGDNDTSCKGQVAAYHLANRLIAGPRKLRVEVRLPDLPDTDWNDVLIGQQQ